MIVPIEVTDSDLLIFRVKRPHPYQPDIEESVRKVTKEVDIGVHFCDNTFDLQSATIEDVLIGRIKGEIR